MGRRRPPRDPSTTTARRTRCSWRRAPDSAKERIIRQLRLPMRHECCGNLTYLLHLVRHGPPLPDFGVVAHLLHIAGVVVTDVFEAGKEDAAGVVPGDAICFRTPRLVLPLMQLAKLGVGQLNVQSTMLHSLICLSTSGQTAAWHFLYSARHSGRSLTICATRLPGLRCFVESLGDAARGGLPPPGAVAVVGDVGCQSCDMV